MSLRRQGNKTQSSNARNIITVKYRTQTSDGEGGFNITWIDRYNIWAEICPISASQKFEYDSINVNATHRIKINGNLKFQDNTKWVADTWAISWSGILGTDIQLHYQIDNGTWVLISSSEANSGTYDWTIPIGATGKNVIVRVMHLTDTTSYVLTDPFNIVPEGTRDGIPSEADRIEWTVNGNTRNFEILAVENLQEKNMQIVLTCLEKR
jgi:head-tail adaptor